MQADDGLGPLLPPDDRGMQGTIPAAVPPAIFAEQALLAALLVKPALFDVLPDEFGSHHFCFEDHADIFDVAREAANGGARFLSPAIEAHLPRLGGPKGYVRQIVTSVMGTSEKDVLLYADTLMRMEERRRLKALAEQIRDLAAQPEAEGKPTAQIVGMAMDGLDGIVSSQKWSRGSISLGKAMGNAIRLGQEARLRGDGLSGITTGFRCLDRRLRGWLKGTMHVIAARPGMGKTALALACAIAAAQAGKVVLFISLEMQAEQLAQRALSYLAGVPLDDVLSGAFDDPNSEKATDQAMRLVRAQAEMEELALDIEDEPSLTPAAIKLRIKAAIRRHGRVDQVWVDHLHLTGKSAAAAKHGDTFALSENADALLAGAKEFDVAMMVLAQLNRGVEGREDKRPTLADLRQSGKIEENSFSVTFLYRQDYYTALASTAMRPGDTEEKHQRRIADLQLVAQNTAGKAELIVAKLRMGQVGTDEVMFDGPHTRFYENERLAA